MFTVRKVAVGFLNKGCKKSGIGFRHHRKCVSTLEQPPGQESLKSQLFIPKGILGQPTHHTHPHMIPPGQLTCGIKQEEYLKRRDDLMCKLVKEMESVHTNHVVIIPGAVKQFMTDKIPYPFRQNSDFFYLTGCLEPGAILAMVKPAQSDNYSAVLFVHEKNAHEELWEGPRTGCSASAQLFAVSEARPVEGFSNYVNKILTSKPAILWYHMEKEVNTKLTPTVKALLKEKNVVWADPMKAIHGMRAIKSPAEIELMKETCYIGSQSMNMAMACTKPGTTEHKIGAVLEFACRHGGAEHLAFPPVVAGGARATHIHYVNNNQRLEETDMLLVDSGSQRWLYNSDISRTWPVSGVFSQYHRILYELILTVQKRLIQLLGEQRQPLDQLFDQMCRLLGTHLQQEGILPKDIDSNELLTRAYRLCPHHVSHYLGLDVHDSPLITRNIPVKTNMIVTVEPGIYIRADDTSVPSEFRGVGIRIEDDVLITDDAPLVLTESCVKEVVDIEATVGKHQL